MESQNEDKLTERLRDPRHLKPIEIDEHKNDKKVSQYMLDMYSDDANGLFSTDDK